MNNYQKAIKLRKICENTKKCEECIYYNTWGGTCQVKIWKTFS